MRTFADLMRSHLTQTGYSQRRFAAEVKATSAYISLVCAGKRNAPDLPVVAQWAKTLKLNKQETDELALSASFSRAAPILQQYIGELEKLH